MSGDRGMIITTTPGIEGKRIVEYLGVVTGEAIVGANIFKDLLTAVRDVVGGRSESYEVSLRSARELAVSEIMAEAKTLGGNAIVGLDIDYAAVGDGGSMMMVAISGTAVRVE